MLSLEKDKFAFFSKFAIFFENGDRAVARALIVEGGGCIFIYSSSAWLDSFEIKLISKEVSRAKPEYMNIHPPPQLAF